jgi:hypothetical protein
MRDKNGKESTVTRYVDAQGQQQIVCSNLIYKLNLFAFIYRI